MVGKVDWGASIGSNGAIEVLTVFFFQKSQNKRTQKKIQLRTADVEDDQVEYDGPHELDLALHM